MKEKALFVFYNRPTDRVLTVTNPDIRHSPEPTRFPTGTMDERDKGSIEATFTREVDEELGVVPTAYQPLDHKEPIAMGRFGDFYPYLVTAWEGDIPPFVRDSPTEKLQWEPLEDTAQSPVPQRVEVVRRVAKALIVDLIGEKIKTKEVSER